CARSSSRAARGCAWRSSRSPRSSTARRSRRPRRQRPMDKLSDFARGRLAMVYGATLSAQRRNAAAAKRGKMRREGEGLLAKRDRTFDALEKRGLVEAQPSGTTKI